MPTLMQSYKGVFTHTDNFGQLVGYRIVTVKPGSARTALTIEEKHISPSGAAHGGVLSTFVDFSMGAALFKSLKKGERCSTIEFKINYISPIRLGETIYCDARIKSKGKSHAVMEAHVFRDEGKDVGMALGTYNIYSPAPSATGSKAKS